MRWKVTRSSRAARVLTGARLGQGRGEAGSWPVGPPPGPRGSPWASWGATPSHGAAPASEVARVALWVPGAVPGGGGGPPQDPWPLLAASPAGESLAAGPSLSPATPRCHQRRDPGQYLRSTTDGGASSGETEEARLWRRAEARAPPARPFPVLRPRLRDRGAFRPAVATAASDPVTDRGVWGRGTPLSSVVPAPVPLLVPVSLGFPRKDSVLSLGVFTSFWCICSRARPGVFGGNS